MIAQKCFCGSTCVQVVVGEAGKRGILCEMLHYTDHSGKVLRVRQSFDHRQGRSQWLCVKNLGPLEELGPKVKKKPEAPIKRKVIVRKKINKAN